MEGESVFLSCSADLTAGAILTWTGEGFDCPSPDVIVSNRISVEPISCSGNPGQGGVCGETYTANLTCPSEGNGEAVSWLMLVANRTMNGERVECSYTGITKVYSIHVGGTL